MRRLAVLGNSHTAALREGWEAIRDRRPEFDIDFFAAPGGFFRKLQVSPTGRFGAVEGAKLKSDQLELLLKINRNRSVIDISDVEAVAVAGIGHRGQDLLGLLRMYDVEGLPEGGSKNLLSRAAFDAFCLEIAQKSTPGEQWRGWEKPVYVFPKPIPSETCLSVRGDAKTKFWRGMKNKIELLKAALRAYDEMFVRECARVGITVIAQPASTIGPSGMTAAEYADGDKQQLTHELRRQRDMTHMNAAYGAACLEALFAAHAKCDQREAVAVE